SFGSLLVAAALVGIGSSGFYPQASRVARLASGGPHGLAQSLFPTRGHARSAPGPLLAARLLLPPGPGRTAGVFLVALAGVVLLWRVGAWYRRTERAAASRSRMVLSRPAWPSRSVRRALAVLVALVFSKYVYLTSLTTYLTFYLMHRFGVSVERAQVHLF